MHYQGNVIQLANVHDALSRLFFFFFFFFFLEWVENDKSSYAIIFFSKSASNYF